MVLPGQDRHAAPSSYRVGGSPAFSSVFTLGASDGRLQLETRGNPGTESVATSTVGSFKQVADVHWTFKLTHTVSSGFVITLSGVRNGERTVTTHVLRSSANTVHSTSSTAGGPVSSFNALQFAAAVPQHASAGSLTFSQLLFASNTLGTSAFDGGSLGGGSGTANQWMLFDDGVDLRHHNWNLSGVLTGSRGVNVPGSDIHFGISGYALSVIPLPPAAWTGAATLGAVAGVGLIRRRRVGGSQ